MRMEKVNEQLKREISYVLQQDMSDQRLQFVTLTQVKTSKDLRHARIYYSFLGSDKDGSAMQLTLERAAGLIRKHLGSRLQMRFTPELMFVYDNSIEQASRIEQAIQDIHHEQDSSTENLTDG